eukprot:5419951-Pleurochrysis_carterae.AAC.1
MESAADASLSSFETQLKARRVSQLPTQTSHWSRGWPRLRSFVPLQSRSGGSWPMNSPRRST